MINVYITIVELDGQVEYVLGASARLMPSDKEKEAFNKIKDAVESIKPAKSGYMIERDSKV